MEAKSYFIQHKSLRKGPFPYEQVVAALRAGKVPADAEIIDAATYDIVLESDLLEPPSTLPDEEATKKSIDYGRPNVDRSVLRSHQELRWRHNELKASAWTTSDVFWLVLAFLLCGPFAILAIPFIKSGK